MMQNFKEGDHVWFLWTSCGNAVWGNEATVIFPNRIEIDEGKIVCMCPERDMIHVYVSGETHVCQFGYQFHNDYFFRSKEAAIESGIEQIRELACE